MLALVAWTAGDAHAHQSSIKYVDVTVDGTHATVRFTVAPTDVTEPLQLPADSRPSLEAALAPAVASYVAGWLAIADCSAGPAHASPDADHRFVVVDWQVDCGADIGELELDFTRFFAVDVRHEAILTIHAPGEQGEPSIIRSGAPRLSVRAGEPPSKLAWIHYGIDHIYSGRDHISFVLALLLAIVLVRKPDWEVRSPRSALRSTATIITAFTVAHSLSLIAASLGWIQLPSRLVESLIAVSIIYTAIEDIIRPDVRWRFLLTFGFGLVHGLGFASVLRELLPADHIIAPLLCFNLGVELGQLTIVLVALPMFWLAARELGALRYRRVIMPVLAAIIAVLGAVWLIERVFTIRLLGM